MNVRPALLLVAALALSGCYSRLTGNQGRLQFAYEAAVDVLDFNKPLAPGARLDLLARTLGDDEDAGIASAESSHPEVIRIVAQNRTHVVLQGGAVGAAQITLTTEDGTTDTVDMYVASPTAVSLSHACTNEAFAVYPADSDVVIPFGMSRGEGQPVIGYGFWPIKITPSKALALDRASRDQGALHFASTQPRHRVAIRSTIDDAILGLALASTDEIDGVRVDGAGLPPMFEGSSAMVGFVPSVGGVPFCQASLLTRARSKSPKVCNATARLSDDSDEETNTAGLVRIVAKKYGVCEFEVSFPEAAAGAGLSRSYRLPVGKFPSLDGEAAAERTWPVWAAPLLALIAPLMLLPFARRR